MFLQKAKLSKRKALTKKIYKIVSFKILKLNKLRAKLSYKQARPIAISVLITASLNKGLQKQLYKIRNKEYI